MKITNYDFLGEPIDAAEQFHKFGSVHYIARRLNEFNPVTGRGQLEYERFERKARIGFNAYNAPFESTRSWSFPPNYSEQPSHPFEIAFVSQDTVRIRTACGFQNGLADSDSLMLDGAPGNIFVTPEEIDGAVTYRTQKMSVEVRLDPFQVVIRDINGRELTRTLHQKDSFCLNNYCPMPFSYVRSATDMRKFPAVSLSIHPGEHFYGCGESFTKLDKLGRRVVLWTKDAGGSESEDMYKPIPFFISSRGYGLFNHSSNAMTLDFGCAYAEAQTTFSTDENIDLFFFAGTPKEVLASYTDLTGRSPVPPVWSFGLWMSRITYKSEDEVRRVADKLRENRIPCDVIHIDTGWFEHDWRCDYKFAPSRFDDAKKMISDLKDNGYRICLWQLPYFTPGNSLYKEILEKGLAVKGADTKLPTDDAILDFSNPETVRWYQEHLKALHDMGVAAIKADFGEAAPVHGVYRSGNSGVKEHNLYPLRYNKAAFEISGEGIIWGRSAWAGSQRYPLHWGGDSENTDMGMLSTMRGGLSLGACGFSFWSHDAGGFVRKSPEELYGRWMFMGIFSSHIRCHGQPPKEPWEFSPAFLELFREIVELRYKLIPYILEQSRDCSERGLPLARAMFIEHPGDPACLTLDEQYYFGGDMIIAPLFEAEKERSVYLPEGEWTDFFTGKKYAGKGWYSVIAEKLPGLAFVRSGAEIPMAEPAPCTDLIEWEKVKRVKF